MYKRHITESVLEALTDTPIILVNGARQTGKSTLCQTIFDDCDFQGPFVTMDDPTTLLAAQTDPLGFLRTLGNHAIIDEVQRTPELFLPLKKLIDENRQGMRFILTGSANVMTLPKVSDSLAGRTETLRLWPLSQDEIAGRRSKFLDILVEEDGQFPSSVMSWNDVAEKIGLGGYPEALVRHKPARRHKWFADYIMAILQKDIRDLSKIEGLSDIPNLIQLIAARVGSTINMSEISRLSGIKNTTLNRYITLLEQIFIIVKLPAWTKNIEGEFVKSPKVYLNDTGLLNHLIGREDKKFLEQKNHAGPYLENFVVMEIIKQISWSSLHLKPYHFSMHKGSEVDLVLEDRTGGLYGIEIKSSESLQDKSFNGLRHLSKLTGNRFKRGIILYAGDQYLGGFGDKLQAVPISALWLS